MFKFLIFNNPTSIKLMQSKMFYYTKKGRCICSIFLGISGTFIFMQNAKHEKKFFAPTQMYFKRVENNLVIPAKKTWAILFLWLQTKLND